MTIKKDRPEKPTTASTTGLLIGLLFGFLVGLGMFKQTQKSERSVVFPYAIGIGVLFTTFTGYKIGALKDEEQFRDACLGINAIVTNEWLENSSWATESYWQEAEGKEHRMLTTLVDGGLVTIYNGSIVAYHGQNSGHRSVSKFHLEVKGDLIQKLKDGFDKKSPPTPAG